MKIPEPGDTVNVGSKVQSLRNVRFCDDSYTRKGEVIEVTEGTLAYFRLFTDNKYNYKLLQDNTNDTR